MTLRYRQSTGEFWRDGKLLAIGYSGAGVWRNQPMAQDIWRKGPIPCGWWTLGRRVDTASHGPCVLPLTPDDPAQTLGRSGFLIHGDSRRAPGTASQGCIIVPLAVRQALAEGDRLEVVP